MNVICNQLKCMSVLVGSTLPQSIRNYATIRKIPVTWVEPTIPSCVSKERSGDGGVDFGIKPTDIIKSYKDSKELENADQIIKKMFTVDFNRKKDINELEIEKAMKMVQRHKYDIQSMEVVFGRLTAKILHLQKRMEEFPYEKLTKVQLKELIEKRQKWLKKLRIRDYPCFEYILEKFNLTFHPGIRREDYEPVVRTSSTKRLLQKYCDKEIQKKIDSYRAELEAQQKDFFKEKAEKLEFIRNEEIACGVEPTVTEEEIAAAKEKAESFV